ncbi:hypothetical protein ACSBR1_037554 [Camellia fascicularis]
MFNSDEWKNSRWGKATTGQPCNVKKIILGKEFWQKATKLCKVHEPLVRVLRLVDGDEKPTMGFIYEAIDRAKLAIKRDCRYYTKHWKIIDTRWSFQLHQDLNAVGKCYDFNYKMYIYLQLLIVFLFFKDIFLIINSNMVLPHPMKR